MEVSALLVELLNATLCHREPNGKLFEGLSEDDWQRCFNMALSQGVLAMLYPTVSLLPKEFAPPLPLSHRWMSYQQTILRQTHFKKKTVSIIGSWLAEDGLATIILKGFSLSVLYPNPNLREFGDIDIFSCNQYDAVNACFAKHGTPVRKVDGHHAYLKMNGIPIEHHFAFTNTKVKKGVDRPEAILQQLILRSGHQTPIPGILLPNNEFQAIHVGNHAFGHFLQEKIMLRQLIDWVLVLKQLTEQEADEVLEIKGNTLWGKFTSTLTAIAIHKLLLPQSWFPKKELEFADCVSPELESKVWNDIMNTSITEKTTSSILRRAFIARRILNNSWKYKEYSNVGASQLLLKLFFKHLVNP